MSYKPLKQKVVMMSEQELHYCEVLKKVYKINPSQYIRQAFIDRLKKEIPELREKNKKLDCPF